MSQLGLPKTGRRVVGDVMKMTSHRSAAVIDKPVLPPSDDPHAYMNWAP
jgi:hypothetical protein